MIVGVIGSGSIGPDLAYGFLSAIGREPGSKVYLVDLGQSAKKGVERGKLSLRAAAAIDAALVPTLELADLADCEYVLEAASENLDVKKKILANLERVVGDSCLIGFATSGLPRAQIAAGAQHPGRCFVNHPFFPAWRSPPVEVVLSGDEAMGARMIATMKRLGKVPVVTTDVECFAADDVFCNYISEAARIVAEGIATPAQVDKIVNDAIGGGGPFNVMDATRGNLLTVHCQQLMRDAKTGSAWFEPPAILSKTGNDAWHDRKNPGDPSHDAALGRVVLDRILAVLLARTYFVVDNGICSATEMNWMSRLALGFRTGLLELAAELGADRVNQICTAYAANNPGFAIPASIADRQLASFRTAVTVERRGDIGIIRVHRPEVMNALSEKTVGELDAAFRELDADAAIAGVVFSIDDGALAGADITELASLDSPEACRGICTRAHPILARIAGLSKPVVAAVDGPVLGGGAEFSMACHARVVGKRAMIGQPEVNLGIVPGYGGTQRLPRLIGLDRANVLLRTASTMSAAQACEWGWATGAPSDDVIAAAIELIKRHLAGEVKITPMSPEPIPVPATLPAVDIGHRSLAIDAILVDVLRRGLASSLDEGLVIEADGFGRCKQTVDMDIGMKNFMQNGPRVPALFLHE